MRRTGNARGGVSGWQRAARQCVGQQQRQFCAAAVDSRVGSPQIVAMFFVPTSIFEVHAPPPAHPSPALAAAHTAAHTAARPPPPQSASTVYKVGACLFIFFQLVRAAQPALPKRERETRAPF